jgi:hypothetical protein
MLANVNENVMTLRRRGSKALSCASFCLIFFQPILGDNEGALALGIVSFLGNFKLFYLKPYFVKLFLKLVMETPAETIEANFDVLASIRKHVAQLKPITTKRGLICVGEYPAKLILKESLIEKNTGLIPVFIQKPNKEALKNAQAVAKPHDVLSIDADVDTHFWFNVNTYLQQNEEYAMRLKNLAGDLHEVILFASLWEGLGSALLPTLISQFKTSKASLVALAILPSKAQPADAHFNALASIGLSASNEAATVVLFGRDAVEDFVGVDRNGSRMKGNTILNYMIDIMLAKDTFTQELSELSRTFNIKQYTTLAIMGASFKVYGSFESILAAAGMNPFLQFNIATASVLYVLIRIPLHLKEKLSKGKIELATANWSKTSSSIKSIYISEPIYIDDASDRIDVIVFAGGFDLTELTVFLQKKAAKIKTETVKKGVIKEKEWETILKALSATG